MRFKPRQFGSAGTGLVLWDIDHTLVDTAGISRQAYLIALRRVANTRHLPDVNMNGRTDLAIMSELLELVGLDATDKLLHSFRQHQAQALGELVPLLASHGRAMPGAAAAVCAVASWPGVVQSVVTGNIPATARIKLSTFGLDTHLDLDVGGFGDCHTDREMLVRNSRLRAAERYGEPAAVVIIGDTCHDVLGGRSAGAFVVAVASGRVSADRLALAGADLVLPDLRETGAVITSIHRGLTGAAATQNRPGNVESDNHCNTCSPSAPIG